MTNILRGSRSAVSACILGILTFVMLSASTASAKELTNRLGIGVKNNNSEELPALATVYYPNSELAFTGSVGIDTKKNNSKLAFNAGVRKILFKETNMNFYYGGQAGYVSYEELAVKHSGFELSGLFGAEFFLPGLESLALTFEGGLGITSLDTVRFRTIGDHPLRAGIIFYF
ncbi:MAG: organic solvent tolerance protein [Bdellovibrionota bacterium]